MAAIDLIGPAFGNLESLRREELANARAEIDKKLESRRVEFVKLVNRAHGEGASKSEIARAADVSRTTVYNWLEQAGKLGEIIPLAVDPYSAYVNATDDPNLFDVNDPDNTSTMRVDINGTIQYELGQGPSGEEWDTVQVLPSDTWRAWFTAHQADIVTAVRNAATA